MLLATGAALDVGTSAPQVAIPHALQPVASSALEGRHDNEALILEFWATWCGPCVESIEHTNRLVQDAGPNVRVLWITDEAEEIAASFVTKHPLQGVVVIDDDSSLFEAFEVNSRPTLVVIDRAGIIRFIGHPKDLDSKTLADAISGKSLPEERQVGLMKNRNNPLLEVVITPSATGEFGKSQSAQHLDVEGQTLEMLLVDAHGLRGYPFVYEGTFPEYRYDAKIRRSNRDTSLEDLLARAIDDALGLRTTLELRRSAVFELRNVEFKGTPMSESHYSLSLGSDGVTAECSFGQLVEIFSMEAQRPVVDVTKLPGNYKFALTWKRGDLKSLKESLQALGLSLKETERDVERLVVRRKSENTVPSSRQASEK